MADQDQDIFSKYGGTALAEPNQTPTTPAREPVSVAPSTTDPFSQYGGRSVFGGSSEQPVSAQPPSSLNPFENYGGVSLGSSESELSHPEFQSATPSRREPEDPNAPWYKKLWQGLNEPLINDKEIGNFFGWDIEHWGGLRRGLLDFISGLTSPLSIGLTIGTLGLSALEWAGVRAATTAGEAALSNVLSADEIAQVVSGSKLVAGAVQKGAKAETAWSAMPALGIDPAVVKTGLEKLAEAGVKPESLLATGIIRRAGGAMLRQAGIDAAQSDKVASLVELLTNAGFTLQNAYGAIITAPRVFDAFKEGDTDAALRYAVNAVGSGAFAAMGVKGFREHAGDLMSRSEAAMGLRVKPSDENIKMIKSQEQIALAIVKSGEYHQKWVEEMFEKYPDILPQNWLKHIISGHPELAKDPNWIAGMANESDLRARFYRESEGNLQEWHDAIAKSVGLSTGFEDWFKGSKVVTDKNMPLTAYHGTTKDFVEFNTEGSATHPFNKGRENPEWGGSLGAWFTAEPKLKGNYDEENAEYQAGSYTEGRDFQPKIGANVRPVNLSIKNPMEYEGYEDFQEHRDTFKSLEEFKKKLIAEGYDGIVIRNSMTDGNVDRDDWVAFKPEQIRPVFEGKKRFSESIQRAVDSANIKNKPKQYIDQLLKATDPSLLTEQEKLYSKDIGEHFDENLERAIVTGGLRHGVINYITRVFKKAEDSDLIRKFKTLSEEGGFSLNTGMARKRIFNTTLEGILKGYELSDDSLVGLAAHNGNVFDAIAARRNWVRRFRAIRGSDGMPAGVISGRGNVVEVTDPVTGTVETPAVVINPKGISSIQMSQDVVDGLSKRPEIDKPEYQSKGNHPEGWFNDDQVKHIIKGGAEPVGIQTDADDKPYLAMFNDPLTHSTLGVPISELTEEAVAAKLVAHREEWKKFHPDFKAEEPTNIKVEEKQSIPTSSQKFPTDLDRLMKQGKVVRYGQDKNGNDLYAFKPVGYKQIDHPALQGWKFVSADTNGTPIFVHGDMLVHPEFAEYVSRYLGVDKGFPKLKKALSLSREAKGILLAFSPFHLAQEGLRALMSGVSPIGVEKFNPNNPMHVLAAEKGVWESKSYRGVSSWEEGLASHSELISKIPVLGDIQDSVTSFLFDRYIPGLKLRAFERMYDANKKLHSDWLPEKLANETADEVNERFGGLPYKRMGRSLATMDIARLTTLAPDWLESEMRFMKRVFSGEEGALARRDVLKMTAAMWVTARMLNYLINGKPHNEAPFGVAWKDEDGREKVYSIRTLPTDMLHAVHDPLGFMNGRMSPMLRTGIQTYTGRDEYGRKMNTNGVFVNLLKNVSPISLQTLVKKATGEDTAGITNADQIARASGLTVYPYRTEAQKLAAKLASDHSEAGPVDQDKLRRHQGLIELENRIRQGKVPITEVYKGVEQGVIHVDEAKRMVKVLKDTQGLDPDMSRFYAHASRLPMKELLQLWDESLPDEKAAISKLFIKKATAYLKKANREMSPAERQSDVTYIKLRRMLPSAPPF